jgi:hypothetical protein
LFRCTGFPIRIDERENIISRDHHTALFLQYLVTDERNPSPLVLKHDWLGSDDAKDKDVKQQASFACENFID